MNRLVHSESGHVRSLQISTKKFFVYVEGGLDRIFIDQLLRRPSTKLADEYEIRAAKELPGNTGGKPTLLKHYNHLRQKRLLKGDAFGKKFTTAFIFDKDIDDLFRTKAKSPHAIYTDTYDLEGHLFTCGNLGQALAVSTGITHDQAQKILGNESLYLGKIADRWADWIALCIVSQLTGAHVGCTFDRVSTINSHGMGETDIAARNNFIASMARKLDVPIPSVEKKHKYYLNLVRREARAGRPFRFFRGKWMREILQQHTAKSIQIPDANIDSLCTKVITALVSQVGGREDCRCCASIHNSLLPLAAAIV